MSRRNWTQSIRTRRAKTIWKAHSKAPHNPASRKKGSGVVKFKRLDCGAAVVSSGVVGVCWRRRRGKVLIGGAFVQILGEGLHTRYLAPHESPLTQSGVLFS